MAKKKKKAEDEKPKKKGKKAIAFEDEDDAPEEEEYSPEAASKPRMDIYVGLSAITMVLLITAAVFFYLDHDAGKAKALPQVSVTLAPLQAVAAPAPAPAGQ